MSRHLSKLFDSLCKLKFKLDANEKPLKFGLGMYSKEDEYVDFDKECDLSGQVSARAGHTPLTRRHVLVGHRPRRPDGSPSTPSSKPVSPQAGRLPLTATSPPPPPHILLPKCGSNHRTDFDISPSKI